MKKLLLFIFFTGAFCIASNSQNYHEQDKEGLREILRQKGTAYTKELPPQSYIAAVFELYGLTEADTLNWYNDESWVEVLSSVEGLKWSDSELKKIEELSWTEGIENLRLDCSYFPELKSVGITIVKYTMPRTYLPVIADLSQNEKLAYIGFMNASFVGNPIFNMNNQVETISVFDGWFTNSYLECLPKLKELFLYNSGTGELDFANNPLIERIDAKNSSITKIDASTNQNLKYLDCSYGQLVELLVSDTPTLDTLICDYNYLRMQTMPYREVSELYRAGPQGSKYDPENPMSLPYDYIGVAYVEDKLDMRDYYMFRGVKTNFDCFSYEWDESYPDIEIDNGLITLTSDMVGKRISCSMSNACFPGYMQTHAYDIRSRGPITGLETVVLNGGDIRLESSTVMHNMLIVVLSKEAGRASLYNMRGQNIANVDVNSERTEIQVASTGIYLLKVNLNNGISKTFKVVVK